MTLFGNWEQPTCTCMDDAEKTMPMVAYLFIPKALLLPPPVRVLCVLTHSRSNGCRCTYYLPSQKTGCEQSMCVRLSFSRASGNAVSIHSSLEMSGLRSRLKEVPHV